MTNTLAQARRMMTEDSNVLRKTIADLGPDALTAHHLVDQRPLGDARWSQRPVGQRLNESGVARANPPFSHATLHLHGFAA